MRIRKRKVPLPLSLLSPVPLSDPDLFGRSPVTLQHSPPSDHVGPTSTLDLRRSIQMDYSTAPQPPLKPCLSFEENEEKQEIIGASVDMLAPLSSVVGARSLGDHTHVSILSEEESSVVKKRPRTTNVGPTLVVEEGGKDKNALEGGKKGGGGGSKGRRGNTIMEGSRCSRVNGRGWRCCQPTLVGYSLCEHHLGKGRLRSMTSVRGRPPKKEAALAEPAPQQPQPPPPPGEAPGQGAVMVSSSVGKRVKLGGVKARSLSSLLGQQQTAGGGSDGEGSSANDGSDQIVYEGV